MPMTHDEDEKDWKVTRSVISGPRIPQLHTVSDSSYLGFLFPSYSLSKRSILFPFLRTPTPYFFNSFVACSLCFDNHLSPRAVLETGLRKYVLCIQFLLTLVSCTSGVDLLGNLVASTISPDL